jgi:Fungal specific transcription factor domain
MGEMQLALPKPIDMRVERDMVEKLLNVYFTEIAPIFPVITQAEFLTSPSPPPILLYSCCLVAAARREVPQSIFDTIRYAANNVIKAEDVMSTASIANVQSLLILCMVADSHSQFVPNALSGLWVRAGTAIRMVRLILCRSVGKWLLIYCAGARPWSPPSGICEAKHRIEKTTLGSLCDC